jgi:hypothetical protein
MEKEVLMNLFGQGRSNNQKSEKPLTPATAMKVTAVSDEYRFVEESVCECSRTGTLKVKSQGLSSHNGVPMDVLEVRCEHCGVIYNFYFDLSETPHFKKLLKRVPDIGNIFRKLEEDRGMKNLGEDDF